MKNYKLTLLSLLLTATPIFAYPNKPLEGLNIMLDPGHGGIDSGTVGKLGLKESDTNLRVARYLKMLLEHDGANVTLTREKPDVFISLSKRVSLSNEAMPDLFVSVHHNASLKPRTTNRSEIYYNGLDKGVSKTVGETMSNELLNNKFAGESVVIPAGFYVLRNNNAPAILTEGSYISIPDAEKMMRSAKGLTKEAEILWKSIRKSYANGPLKINLYSNTENKLTLNNPYFNILFTANKPVKNAIVKIGNKSYNSVDVKNVMAYPLTYSLYNESPLKSGIYEMFISAESYEGMPSAPKKLTLEVDLPIGNTELKPVSPYIPAGFKGKFPIDIKIFDELNSLNTKSFKAKLAYGDKQVVDFVTSPTGNSTSFIDLNGNEKSEVKVDLIVDDKMIGSCNIPVSNPKQRFFLGKLMGFENKPLENALIKHNGKLISKTNSHGLFYISYPLTENNYTLEILPGNGYEQVKKVITTNGEPVILPMFKLEALSPALLNKSIAIMNKSYLSPMARNLTTPLTYAGANITTITMDDNASHPEYEAVAEANRIKNLNFLISIKAENIKGIELRHYYNSKNGKKLAEAVKSAFKEKYPNVAIKSCPGSDHELGHSGAVALVIAIPSNQNQEDRDALINHLSQALKTEN